LGLRDQPDALNPPGPASVASARTDEGTGTPIDARWLDVRDVVVELGGQRILDGVGFSLVRGELGCLLGPSGCGKTTLLRAIAGLQDLRAGAIAIDGREISNGRGTIAPEKRGVGLVFQDLALFPHLDVAGNIGFGIVGLARKKQHARISDLLERLQLTGLQHRYPHELSGGQQQRVAIARALAPRPALLLLDEPFSNLDATLRTRLRGELRTLLKQLGHTALLVTHDQEEAMGFADRVAVMAAGRIVQFETPWRLYHHPVNRHVAGFVGDGALLPVERDGHGWRCALGPLAIGETIAGGAAQMLVLVRPDDIQPAPDSPLRAEIEQVEFRGAEEFVTLKLAGGERIHALWPSHDRSRTGTRVGIRWQTPHFIVFPADDDVPETTSAPRNS
jgi:iron(III) transport system ATP-binding protein